LQIIREPTTKFKASFLRNLIDALRLVRGDASDLVLPEESSEEYRSRWPAVTDQDGKRARRLATDIRAAMKKLTNIS
jgi:hypothetical protein